MIRTPLVLLGMILTVVWVAQSSVNSYRPLLTSGSVAMSKKGAELPSAPERAVQVELGMMVQAVRDVLFHLGQLTVLTLSAMPPGAVGLMTLVQGVLALVGLSALLGAWKKN